MQPAGRPHSCHETRHRSGATAAQHVPARYGRIPPCSAQRQPLPAPSRSGPGAPLCPISFQRPPCYPLCLCPFSLPAFQHYSHPFLLPFGCPQSFPHPHTRLPILRSPSVTLSFHLFIHPSFLPTHLSTHPPTLPLCFHPSFHPTHLSLHPPFYPCYQPTSPSAQCPFHPPVFPTSYPLPALPSIHFSHFLSSICPLTIVSSVLPSIHPFPSFLLSIYPFVSPFHSGPLPKCRQTSFLPSAAPVTHPDTHPPPLPVPLPRSSLPHSLSPPYPSPRDLLFLFKSFPGWVGNRISFFLDAFPGFAAAAGQARGSGRGLRGRCPRVGAGGSRSRLAPALPPPHPRPFFPPDPVGETLFKDGKSQAWGSLSPGVQKGKSTAAPSPGQVPLPLALAFSTGQQPPETLSRPLPGTAHAGHGHRGAPVPAAASASGWEHLPPIPRGEPRTPTVGSSRPVASEGSGVLIPRAPQRGESRVRGPGCQELRDIRRGGSCRPSREWGGLIRAREISLLRADRRVGTSFVGELPVERWGSDRTGKRWIPIHLEKPSQGSRASGSAGQGAAWSAAALGMAGPALQCLGRVARLFASRQGPGVLREGKMEPGLVVGEGGKMELGEPFCLCTAGSAQPYSKHCAAARRIFLDASIFPSGALRCITMAL